MTHKTVRSILFSLVLVLVLITTGFFVVRLYLQDERTQDTVSEDLEVAGQVAVIGQQYVRTLASYSGDAPVIVRSVSGKTSNKTVVYESLYELNDIELIHEYSIEFQGSQVATTSIRTATLDRSIYINEPQPSEIVQSEDVLIKGEGDLGGSITVALLDEDEKTIYQSNVLEKNKRNNTFIYNLPLSNVSMGEYKIQIGAGNQTLYIPIEVARDL